jgi:redox-sensitive bicupin YhaK (pirin superfamily)
MSGPVTSTDASPVAECGRTERRAFEVLDARVSRVGALTVHRALPRRHHRTVGSWCFADHLGPFTVTEAGGDAIGPHPHIGLQTVTWLLAGELVHRDSLGSEQKISPGQLNLMTAGHGVAHAEEAGRPVPHDLHGIQLWVAQPEATRHGPAAFEHHDELPVVDLQGQGSATVLVGELAGSTSPARRDTDHLGADLALRPGTTIVPLRPGHEHALIVLTGDVDLEGTPIGPGQLAYLGTARDQVPLTVREDTRVMLLGGEPFPEDILMWWNFVARTPAEIAAATTAWPTDRTRFGSTGSSLPRIAAPSMPTWTRPRNA